MAPKRSARSPTGDSFDMGSDDESVAGGGSSAGAAKKGKESKQDRDQRKAQNRIAQREFRQRKVQYVRDLEARLALYESSRDDQIDQLKGGMRALLDENQQLRSLLAGVSGFIGEGVGGVLTQLGTDLPEFQELIHRGRTDNVIETISSLREASKRGDSPRDPNRRSSGGNAVAGPSTSKRPRTSEVDSDRHLETSLPQSSDTINGGLTKNGSSSNKSDNPYFFSARPSGHSPLSDIYGLSGSYPPAPFSMQFDSPKEMGAPDPEPLNRSTPQGRSQNSSNDPASEKALRDFRPPMTHQEINNAESGITELFSTPTDNPKLQAIQLISYHMRNKREQPSYHLPPSLKATVTQQSVPHSPFFDGIIFASLRDRLILLKDQYDLPSLVNDLIDAFVIHEDDILLPTNWEISETFLRKYWYVIDQEVLAISNHWRRARGDKELTMRQLVPDGQDISAEGALGTRRRD